MLCFLLFNRELLSCPYYFHEIERHRGVCELEFYIEHMFLLQVVFNKSCHYLLETIRDAMSHAMPEAC